MTQEQLKHLEFIQNVITRMNSNSFSIKGWMITIVSAFLALYASSKNIDYILFAIPIVIVFWLLDSYYLLQERKFRALYNDKAGLNINPKDVKDFEMNPALYTKNDDIKYSFFNVFKSVTQWMLYFNIVVSLLGFYGYIKLDSSKKGVDDMARKVFFSFKYEDVNRAMVVRNSWVVQGKESAGFIDKAEFEEVKQKGDKAIQTWIDEQLQGTSVTVVLIGENTCKSKWVKYEIDESIKRGNGILAIDISKIKDLNSKKTSQRCGWMIPKGYKNYLWNKDDGYKNMGAWIEEAAKKVGK